ncbi:MAG: glycosyltransferase family 4 protein [Bacteroidales bacterium]|nr:glycosyltransferase family 4 protein [Bacteroidales bacterium]
MNLRVLIIGEAFYPEDFIINHLVAEWSDQGYDIEILTRTPSYPLGKPFDGYKNRIYQQTNFGKAKVHRIPIVRGYHKNKILKILNYINFVFMSSIVALIIGRKFDKIFVYQTGPLTVAIPAILIHKIYGKKVSLWVQDLWPDTVYAYGYKKRFILATFLDIFVKSIYRNCDKILVSCEGFKKRINSYVPDKTLITAPNWPLIDSSISQIIDVKLADNKFNFTFAGNIGKVQNLDNIILGFNLFIEKGYNAQLNIIGDGSFLLSLKELAQEKSIKNIVFWGRKPLTDMPGYFHASDVLILSLVESPIYELTIPSKFAAYLTTGKPIMGVIKGITKELIDDNTIGFAAEPSDINSISACFEAFINQSKTGLDNMKKNTSVLLKRDFDKKMVVDRITKVLFE